MVFIVKHSTLGRIRLQIPGLSFALAQDESMLLWLQKQTWINSARINYSCNSLVIEYDKKRLDKLDNMLSLLKNLSFNDISATLERLDFSDILESVDNACILEAPHKKSWPLSLPTVSLMLAFFSNPLITAVNIPLMLYSAFPVFKRAWNIWQRENRLNIDFLDTLAITASIGQGNMVAGGVITWLICLGDWIRDLTAAGSKRAVGELLEFRSKTAWIVKDETIVSIPATELAVGDTVVVYPGEMIPVDGEIIHGHGMVDQKTITGEGLPVSRTVGDAVFAATILREGQLTLNAIRVGVETTAGQIARLVESAPIGDTRMQNHAERFADRLVLPTLSLAIGTALLTRDFDRFLSLVIVDYGTGIRVAAPTSVLSSMIHAARVGIVIKSGRHMEKLAQVDTVVFDKTGTLSHGTPHVVDIMSFNVKIDPKELLALAVAAETHYNHPVAQALREKAKELDVVIPQCDETEFKIGLGIEGRVGGYYMHIGSEFFMRQSNIKVDHIASRRATIDEHGYSCLYVSMDGELSGLIAYEDRIRPESRQIIETLHSMGIKDTIMLTGDNEVVAKAVGGRLGLTRQVANMMPAGKAEVIQQLQKQGRIVAMIGDGINDSPALSFADIGIAMKHGADITHESADVILMEDSLWKLIKAIEISKDAVSLIKQNYSIVAAMNTVALGLALPGRLITPELTAVISNGSAILASLNGIRPALRHK